MAKWKKVSPEEKQKLAGRLRTALARRKGIREKRMFGGTCFLLNGNMLCGTGSGDFMFRVGKAAHAKALARPGAKPMRMNGRLMAGFIWVSPDTRGLASWIKLAASFVGGLSRKASTPRRSPPG